METWSQSDNGSSLNAFNIAMIIIPTVFIVIRFWSRSLAESSKAFPFWWDDWTVLAALPFSVVACALHIYTVTLGLSQHVETISTRNLEEILKALWISYWMGDIGLALPKASVLFFYSRVLTTQNRAFKYGLWFGHILNVLWWIASIARCLIFCTPVDKYWDRAKPGHCRSADALYIASAVPSVAIDLYILLLPLPIIWGLSMKLSRKILVAGVFLSGYLVIAISLGRLITSVTAGKTLDEDFTYNGIVLVFWVTAEPAVSIIGCCLPMTFHLIRRYHRQGFSSLFSTRKRSPNSDLKQTSSSEQRSFGKRYRFQLGDPAFSPSKETSSEIQLYTHEPDEEDGVAVKRSGSPDMEMGEKLTRSIIVQKDVDIQSTARV